MPDTAETAHITAPRSMAHLLRTTLMAVGILSLLLSVVGAALLFQHAFAEHRPFPHGGSYCGGV